MSDIMFSAAWECGDRDCPVQWHKASYWLDESGGYTVDNYSDGDHDDIEENELPSLVEVDRSWREYAAYVAKHGCDPLGEYYVKHSAKVSERWEFKFNPSILGPVLREARRGRRKVLPGKLPDYVKQYLQLDKGNRKVADFADWKAFEQAVPGVAPMRWVAIQIEHDKPRNPETVKRELRKLARRKEAA